MDSLIVSADLKITGDKELARLFNNLTKEISRTVASKAVTKGKRVIANQQRRILRSWGKSRQRTGKNRTGDLARLLKVRKNKKKRNSHFVSAFVKLPTRKELEKVGLQSENGYMPTALEFGFTQRGGSDSFSGVKFMRRGFDEKKGEAFLVFLRIVDQELKRIEVKSR